MFSGSDPSDTGGVRRDLSALLVAVLLVGGFSAAAVAVNNTDDGTPRAGHSKSAKADHPGRPPWAHAGKNDKGHGDKGDRAAKQAWKKYWHDLTPAQRADKMAELAKAHADGMKKFAACVKAAGEDKSARAECERPLPPGLAKKLLH